MKPLVSCILATGKRRHFLKQAIKYYQRQTYDNKELIIIDDDSSSAQNLVPEQTDIKYIKLDAYKNLGTKLNIGIKQAQGQIIQKLDDDDYYAPDFLTATIQSLEANDSARSIVGFGCFLVLIAATGELKYSGMGWCAGGTLCFSRKLWEAKPFRDIPRAVDWTFLRDHDPRIVRIHQPELYMLVRHNSGHLWTKLGKSDVTSYFKRRQTYRKTLDQLLSPMDVAFYNSLKSNTNST